MPPEHSSLATSPSLLRRLCAHDPDAWIRATKLYGPLVYGWARKAKLQEDDARDLVQEVYCALSADLPRFEDRPTAGSFRRWLWGITQNKVKDHYRCRAQAPKAMGGSTANAFFQETPEECGIDPSSPPGFPALVRRAMGLLQSDFEPQTWQAFWRTAVDGRTSSQVAEELGTTSKAVRQAKYRVLQRLRAELDELPSEGARHDGDSEASPRIQTFSDSINMP